MKNLDIFIFHILYIRNNFLNQFFINIYLKKFMKNLDIFILKFRYFYIIYSTIFGNKIFILQFSFLFAL